MKRLLFTILICALLAPLGAKAEVIDRIVARVNDDVVTLYDVRQNAIPFVLQQGTDPAILNDAVRRQSLYKEVLEDLVDRKLLVQEAQKLELTIKDEELDQWLAFTRQQQGGITEEQFVAQIENEFGMRYDAYREMVRQNLLKIRMIKIKVGSQVNVTPNEVDQLCRERFGNCDVDKFVTLSHIHFVPEGDTSEAHAAARKRAIAAQQRLASGEEFEKVARELSEGPAASKGGFLGSFKRGELDPEFEKVAFAMKPGDVSDIVRTKFGYHIITVSDVEERASGEVDSRKELIHQELQQKAMERLLDQYLQTLRTRSFVDVRY